MFDSRHCKKKDLKALNKEYMKIFKAISNQNSGDLHVFLLFIDRFDKQIAERMRSQIQENGNNYKKIKEIIIENIEELKQNVIVDIYEHENE
ncbi:MAG: hypothetical protein SPL00_03130 [Bacilli bacterium]|nr:hypothetical protein [Bacilli bacterium]